MTRQELIDQLALNARLGSKAAATDVLDHVLELISNELVAGNDVYLGQSFGGFAIGTRAAKEGVAMGVAYSTPERKVPKFKPSAKLKAAVAAA